MVDVSYDEIVRLAEQLPESEQDRLIYHLRAKQAKHRGQNQESPVKQAAAFKRGSQVDQAAHEPTREQLIHELNDLRAVGAFKDVESLYGKYANPHAPEMSEEAFHADLHAIATEWEEELDEFNGYRSS